MLIFITRVSRCFATVSRISVTLSSQTGVAVVAEDVVFVVPEANRTSFDNELLGDGEAPPLSSSSPKFDVPIDRFNGWPKVGVEWILLLNGKRAGEERRVSFRLPLNALSADEWDSTRGFVNCEWSISLKLVVSDGEDDCFGSDWCWIALWSTCSRFFPAAVVLYL